MDIHMTAEIAALLFITGLSAGFVDAIAGGGGLIALPVLLSIGLPPQIALGTNKLQGTFGTLASSYQFFRKGQVDFREAMPGILYTFVGAAAGTTLVQNISPSFLGYMVPVLLVGVFVYTLFSKSLGYERRPPKMASRVFYTVFGLALGFYDGFFGPGAGSFWMAAFCVFLGFDLTRSAGFTRAMNFTSNLVSLAVFILGGNVLYSVGLLMAAGQFIGGRLGANLAMKKGAGFIRLVFLTVVAATVARLVYVTYLA
ncbi:TSUP family transporter [Desulfococcus sp.]|uniref:TSUP family transporter n=1 Tax=Desulfococcus sp. TaxID=2025834 RepID=UPI003593D2F5